MHGTYMTISPSQGATRLPSWPVTGSPGAATGGVGRDPLEGTADHDPE